MSIKLHNASTEPQTRRWRLLTEMKHKVIRLDSQDPREFPTYSVAEAAAFVDVKPGTLRRWLEGRNNYGRKAETFEPLIHAADPERCLLSFYNIVEAHLLRITRKEYHVPMLQVRRALDWVQKKHRLPHPLLSNDFRTDGKKLFVKELTTYVNASARTGQQYFGDVLDLYLDRISTDKTGSPKRLYPVAGNIRKQKQTPVMIDPRLSSGRLVIEGTGIMALVALERHAAGESYEQLGRDYRIAPNKIRQAVEYLEQTATAA